TEYRPPPAAEHKDARLERQYKQGDQQRFALSRTSQFLIIAPGTSGSTVKFRLELQWADTVQAVDPAGHVSLHPPFSRLKLADLAANSQHISPQLQPYLKSLAADIKLDREGSLLESRAQTEGGTPTPFLAAALQDLNNHLQAQLQALSVALPGKTVQPGA